MPAQPEYFIDEKTTLYHLVAAPDITMDVHYMTGVPLDPVKGNPYDLFKQTMMYATKGYLEENVPVTVNGITGRQVGVGYTDPTGVFRFIFSRAFFWNDKALLVTISATVDNLEVLLDHKSNLFNSLSITR